MKASFSVRWILVPFLFCSIFFLQAQDQVSIDRILSDPETFDNQLITIKGQVTRFTPGNANNTDSFLLLGEYGNTISITTMDEKPEVFKVYEVTGTVVIDPYSGTPYIIEKSKDMVSDSSGMNNPLILFAFFLGFLVLAVLVIVLLARTSKLGGMERPKEMVSTSGGNSAIDYNNDFKTIRIPTNTPKTLQFIPGKLVIVAGEDKGKEFLISGYPTPKGNIVSIGREVVVGEKMYSHIQLNDRTVSRRQAELIQKDDKLFLRNVSETNYTSLDNKELGHQEVRHVKKNSVIKMGDLEFQYTLD